MTFLMVEQSKPSCEKYQQQSDERLLHPVQPLWLVWLWVYYSDLDHTGPWNCFPRHKRESLEENQKDILSIHVMPKTILEEDDCLCMLSEKIGIHS